MRRAPRLTPDMRRAVVEIFGPFSSRPTVRPCSIFHGRSPLTGKRVGQRHRWSGPAWGQGRCLYCYRTIDEVLQRLPPQSTTKKRT